MRTLSAVLVAALAVVGCQAWGLWSLVTGANERQQWSAAQVERASLQKEWAKVGAGLQEQAASLSATVQSADAEAAAARSRRDAVRAELAGVQKELELARQELERLLSDQRSTRQKSLEASAAQLAAETRLQELGGEQAKLREQIVTLTADREQQAKARDQNRDDAKRLALDLEAAQGQLDAAKSRLQEQEGALANARSQLDVAALELAKLTERKGELMGAMAAAQQKLDSANEALARVKTDAAGLTNRIKELDDQQVTAMHKSTVAQNELSQIELSLQSKRDELAALSRRIDDARADELRILLSIRQMAVTSQPVRIGGADGTVTTRPVTEATTQPATHDPG